MDSSLRDAARAAIDQGRHDDLSGLLDEHPDLAGASTDQGLPLVLYARYRQDDQAVAALLAAQPELDVHTAAALGDLARVRELLEQDPGRATAPAADGFLPLHLACYFGAEDVALELLARGVPCDRPVDSPARLRPLHSAVAGGHLALVEALLARGVTVDARQAGDYTPLMGAAVGGQAAMVEALLAAGADPDLVEAGGRTAADLAAERGHPELAARLR